MPFRKIKDVAVVTGSYEDSSGATKKRYANVGTMMKGDDGSVFILLERHFNPAGIPFKPGADKIVLSLFDPREDNGGASRPANTGTAAAGAPPASTAGRAPSSDADDDIPF
jgi:hypothetical protein